LITGSELEFSDIKMRSSLKKAQSFSIVGVFLEVVFAFKIQILSFLISVSSSVLDGSPVIAICFASKITGSFDVLHAARKKEEVKMMKWIILFIGKIK